MSNENPSLFSPEELHQFTEVVPGTADTTHAVTHAAPVLTPDEVRQIAQQSVSDTRNEVSYLRSELAAVRQNSMPTTSTPGGSTRTEPAGSVPIRWGENKDLILSESDINPLIEKRVNEKLEEYHKNTISPFIPAVQKVQTNEAISTAVDFIRQKAPDLLERGDANQLAQLAIDSYNSSFNPGRTEAERTDWAVNRLRSFNPMAAGQDQSTQTVLPYSTGTPVPAYNQTGRTQAGPTGANPYGYAPGSTIRIKAQSIDDFGSIEAYSQYAAKQEAMHQYNKQAGMNWKFAYE